MDEFLPRPEVGRAFSNQQVVRLGDTGPSGTLRIDAVARYLQDAAYDDWVDSGIGTDETWVVRRTAIQRVGNERWPFFNERVSMVTWCSGWGLAWAQRRTDMEVEGRVVAQAVALWVPIDPAGWPRRLAPSFHEVYGPSALGHKVSRKVPKPDIPDSASVRPWPLRVADFDIVGHVNNAALWTIVSEMARGDVRSATMTHHEAVTSNHVVDLVSKGQSLWLRSNDEVLVTADYATD